jgi:hypothetical protein
MEKGRAGVGPIVAGVSCRHSNESRLFSSPGRPGQTMTPHWPGRFFSNLELIVEMHKPPNFRVIDEICVGPLALHRRCRLERQDSANCNATSAAAIRNGSFTSTPDGYGRRVCANSSRCSTPHATAQFDSKLMIGEIFSRFIFGAYPAAYDEECLWQIGRLAHHVKLSRTEGVQPVLTRDRREPSRQAQAPP